MLNNVQKAETVVKALEQASPQLLAELAATGALQKTLTDRVNAFNLEFVRMQPNRDRAELLNLEEMLLPMLTEFPVSRDQTPLTQIQRQQVESALDQWAENQPQSEMKTFPA